MGKELHVGRQGFGGAIRSTLERWGVMEPVLSAEELKREESMTGLAQLRQIESLVPAADEDFLAMGDKERREYEAYYLKKQRGIVWEMWKPLNGAWWPMKRLLPGDTWAENLKNMSIPQIVFQPSGAVRRVMRHRKGGEYHGVFMVTMRPDNFKKVSYYRGEDESVYSDDELVEKLELRCWSWFHDRYGHMFSSGLVDYASIKPKQMGLVRLFFRFNGYQMGYHQQMARVKYYESMVGDLERSLKLAKAEGLEVLDMAPLRNAKIMSKKTIKVLRLYEREIDLVWSQVRDVGLKSAVSDAIEGSERIGAWKYSDAGYEKYGLGRVD